MHLLRTTADVKIVSLGRGTECCVVLKQDWDLFAEMREDIQKFYGGLLPIPSCRLESVYPGAPCAAFNHQVGLWSRAVVVEDGTNPRPDEVRAIREMNAGNILSKFLQTQ